MYLACSLFLALPIALCVMAAPLARPPPLPPEARALVLGALAIAEAAIAVLRSASCLAPPEARTAIAINELAPRPPSTRRSSRRPHTFAGQGRSRPPATPNLGSVSLALSALAVVAAFLLVKKIFDTPSRTYDPANPNVGGEYDAWTR